MKAAMNMARSGATKLVAEGMKGAVQETVAEATAMVKPKEKEPPREYWDENLAAAFCEDPAFACYACCCPCFADSRLTNFADTKKDVVPAQSGLWFLLCSVMCLDLYGTRSKVRGAANLVGDEMFKEGQTCCCNKYCCDTCMSITCCWGCAAQQERHELQRAFGQL